MAVINAYVNTDLANGLIRDSILFSELVFLTDTFEVAAADDNASKFRLFKLPSTFRPVIATFMTDAITGATDYDFGIYETALNGGAEIDKDCFMDGQSFANASRVLNGLANVAIENIGAKTSWEIAGQTADLKRDVDFVLTANTVGAAAGTIRYQIFGLM